MLRQKTNNQQGKKLYLVAVPIGNLEDITLRAINIFKSVDYLICEDTRRTKQLLKLLSINYENKKFIFINKNNENDKSNLFDRIPKEIKEIIWVSDAGYPTISDPGYKLLRSVSKSEDTLIEVIPGASSIIPSLIYSAFPSNSFYFYGFLSNKNAKRENELNKVKSIKSTLIFFESVHRIYKLLESIRNIFGANCEICVCRELTKFHEEIYRGMASELIDSKIIIEKGEFVVLVNNNEK